MAKPLLDDDLWAMIVLLLPTRPPRRFKHPGRQPVDNRVALTGILFVLKSGIPWEMLPAELGCSGMTCWRRLSDWEAAGVWEHTSCHVVVRTAPARATRSVPRGGGLLIGAGRPRGKKLDRIRRIIARPAPSIT